MRDAAERLHQIQRNEAVEAHEGRGVKTLKNAQGLLHHEFRRLCFRLVVAFQSALVERVRGNHGGVVLAGNEHVNEVEIGETARIPVVARYVLKTFGGHTAAELPVANDFQHGVAESIHIARLEEADDGVIEIKPVDSRAGDDGRDAQGHELHDFGAVGFVAEGVGALGDDAEVSIGHDFRDLADRQRIEKADGVGELELRGELEEVVLHVAIAVDVKLGIGQLDPDFAKGANGDVEPLVPLKAAGKEDDNLDRKSTRLNSSHLG